MKNFVSFLCQRELGRTTKCWKQTKQAEECLEKHACTPEVNQPCALSGQVRATFLMDFSPDGTKVASTHGDHTVRVTELSTGKCTHILSGHPRTPWCLAFHPSSDQILASGCLAGEVRIWDLQGGGSEVWRCKDSLVIASMTFHPIDHVLVFAVGNKIYFWDWNQTEPFACCQTLHEYERIRLVRFDSVGHYLYTGIANNTMVQQANSRISFINGRNNPVARPQRTQRLSSVYNNLVECFRAYRRDRVMNEGSAAEGTNCEYTDAQESSASRERSRSPVHEEGLNFARQYAARVTEATMLPTGSEHERNPSETEPNPDSDSVPFINDSVPPFMAPRPFAWSPPPRGASQADEVGDIIIEEEEEEEEDRVQRPVDLGQINLNHRSSDLHQRSFDLSRRVSALAQRADVLGRSAPDRSRFRSRRGEVRPVTVLDSGHNVRSTTATTVNPGLIDRCRNCTGSSVGENSSSNLVAMERNNETGAMNVRMATNREATTSMSSVLSTRLADSNRSVATHRGLPGSREPPTLQSTPVLRTDSHSGTNGLGQHASDCDNRDCQVCGNFNRSQLTYGRWEPFAGRRFSHARSAFSQPSHTYRQRYRNLNPSRVQVHSYGPARRQGVGVATSQNPISTHVASSQTSTETSSSPVQVPAAESQPSSQQNRLSSLLHLASQAQQGIHIPPSQLNPLLQRLSDSSLPQDSSTGDRLTSQNVDGNAVLQTQGDSYVATNQDSSQSNSVLQTHSDNNNNDQSETSEHTSSGDNNNGQGYRAIQDNFATITARIEREMDELDRRITSLRNSFHESIQQLQQDRDTYLISRQSLSPSQDSQETVQPFKPDMRMFIHYHVHVVGAFMGRGEPAVANNIINHTHRIQAWDFTKCDIPDITDPTVDVIVPHCKLHNDASCDISQDRTLLGTFVPSHRGFPDDNILAIFSLVPESRGQCLFTKSFGPNAISVSISPRTNFVMVGLAAKRLSWVFTSNQLVAQVYKMESELAGEKSTQHVSDIMHPCDMDIRTHVSVNSARWLPGVGDGIIYGTNRGDLHICRPGAKKESEKEKPNDTTTSGTSIRRNLMHMLGLSSTAVPLISIGTQTAERRSAGTQTE
ncbi:activating molecule in BECN1-regulated autophagy protein 1-like [Mizuhopecten yessoensis]|uniref:activating molecule in BECN1-regulated autophagy protein 1-like n=1 Tax=Mizuhopecten yessoensis TaxID=6573 RepID=UPI000B45C376|nr:activating molecule in BECN1-regulated autophagy protein 1-like [Mizuhopecten yessoensis]